MEKESTKLFIVSYVGLSEDTNADGYCETHPFAEYADAKAFFERLLENEYNEQRDAGFEPVIDKHEEREASVEWCNERVILRIEETELR